LSRDNEAQVSLAPSQTLVSLSYSGHFQYLTISGSAAGR
jgi:hypothetical protein